MSLPTSLNQLPIIFVYNSLNLFSRPVIFSYVVVISLFVLSTAGDVVLVHSQLLYRCSSQLPGICLVHLQYELVQNLSFIAIANLFLQPCFLLYYFSRTVRVSSFTCSGQSSVIISGITGFFSRLLSPFSPLVLQYLFTGHGVLNRPHCFWNLNSIKFFGFCCFPFLPDTFLLYMEIRDNLMLWCYFLHCTIFLQCHRLVPPNTVIFFYSHA